MPWDGSGASVLLGLGALVLVLGAFYAAAALAQLRDSASCCGDSTSSCCGEDAPSLSITSGSRVAPAGTSAIAAPPGAIAEVAAANAGAEALLGLLGLRSSAAEAPASDGPAAPSPGSCLTWFGDPAPPHFIAGFAWDATDDGGARSGVRPVCADCHCRRRRRGAAPRLRFSRMASAFLPDAETAVEEDASGGAGGTMGGGRALRLLPLPRSAGVVTSTSDAGGEEGIAWLPEHRLETASLLLPGVAAGSVPGY